MRALLLVLVTVGSVGCATRFAVVPDSQWKLVPVAQRTTMDRDHQAQVAVAKQDYAAAVQALENVRKMPAPRVSLATTTAPAPGDEWAESMKQFEQRKIYAIKDIATASIEWQKARVAFYQSRVVLAQSKVAVLHCSYEVDRAQAVDRNLLGSDTYDSAEYRAQLAQTQEYWYAAEQRTTATREALTLATAKLGEKKAAYAELVREGPQAPTSEDSALRLADWNDQPLRTKTGYRARVASTPKYLELGSRVARK